MENRMELSNEALERIGGYVRRNLAVWIQEVTPSFVTSRELFERVVRVEEELRYQRELMQQGFAAVDRRFEDMNMRFEDVNKRFDDVNMRFEDVNKRFDDVNRRFEDVNRRLDDLNRNSTRWFTVLTVMVAIIGLSGIVLPLLP